MAHFPDDEIGNELERSLIGLNFLVTSRKAEEAEMIVPGLLEALQKPKARIAIVGNGLSELPLLNRAANITVIDAINYDHILTDMNELRDELLDEKLTDEFSPERQNIQAMLNAPNIDVVQYMFGTGNLPKNLEGQFDLVVNVFGPMPSPLIFPEIVQLLKPGGEILADWIEKKSEKAMNESRTVGCSLEAIPSANGTASRIHKL